MAPAAPKAKPTATPRGKGGGRPQTSPTPTPTRSPTVAAPAPRATTPPAPVATRTGAVFGPRITPSNLATRRASTSAPQSTPSASRSAAAIPADPAAPVEPADAATPRRRFDQVSESFAIAASNPQLPLGVLGAMLLFLLVQNRIDRKDPKLGLVNADGDLELEFRAPVRRTDPPVRPRAAPRPRLQVVSRSPYYYQPSALPEHP